MLYTNQELSISNVKSIPSKKVVYFKYIYFNTNLLTYLLTNHGRLTEIKMTIKLYIEYNAHF